MVEITRIMDASHRVDRVDVINPVARWLIIALAILIAIPLVGLAVIVGLVAVAVFATLLLGAAISRRVRTLFQRPPRRENVRIRPPERG